MARKNEYKKKIELAYCPNGGYRCQTSLKKMNDLLNDANDAILAKNYINAIKYETKAFDETLSINHNNCSNCAALFRSTILFSIKVHIHELKKLTSGFSRNNAYLPALKNAETIYDKLNKLNSEINSTKENKVEKEV